MAKSLTAWRPRRLVKCSSPVTVMSLTSRRADDLHFMVCPRRRPPRLSTSMFVSQQSPHHTRSPRHPQSMRRCDPRPDVVETFPVTEKNSSQELSRISRFSQLQIPEELTRCTADAVLETRINYRRLFLYWETLTTHEDDPRASPNDTLAHPSTLWQLTQLWPARYGTVQSSCCQFTAVFAWNWYSSSYFTCIPPRLVV